jgi:hypothetical protein
MSIPLYTFEFALIDFVGLRHALHLEREGYAKVIRHRKGMISRVVLYRRGLRSAPSHGCAGLRRPGLFVCATARRRTSRVEAPATPGRQLRLDAGARRNAADLPGGRAGLLGAGGVTWFKPVLRRAPCSLRDALSASAATSLSSHTTSGLARRRATTTPARGSAACTAARMAT